MVYVYVNPYIAVNATFYVVRSYSRKLVAVIEIIGHNSQVFGCLQKKRGRQFLYHVINDALFISF